MQINFLSIFPYTLIGKKIYLLLIALCFSCTSKNSLPAQKNTIERDSIEAYRSPIWFDIRDTLDSVYYNLNLHPKGNYQDILAEIEVQRQKFAEQLNDSSSNREEIITEASSFLENALVNQVIPHWYNTPWDFNGYTNKPNDGVVACGYFVSTTLKHMGFKLNRYRFAQQYGKISGESLQKPMTIIPCNDEDDFLKLGTTIKNALKHEGLYFVGLDCHVGYILYRKEKLFFLHSSYTEPFKVVIEDALQSDAFISSAFYFSAITSNKELIAKWIKGDKIIIE